MSPLRRPVCKLCKDEQLTEKQEVRVFTWIIYELV